MEFRQRLYELRTQKGISQADLAKALKMSTGTIGMYENGTCLYFIVKHVFKPLFQTLVKFLVKLL